MSLGTKQKIRYRRRRKLIDRPLQLRLVAAFAAVACLSLIVQALALQLVFLSMARNANPRTLDLISALPEKFALAMAFTAVVLLPLSFVVGIVLSFPVVGPLYRFRVYMRDVRDGRETRPCTLRDGDRLKDLAELITEVSEPMRARTLAERDGDCDEQHGGEERDAQAA